MNGDIVIFFKNIFLVLIALLYIQKIKKMLNDILNLNLVNSYGSKFNRLS